MWAWWTLMGSLIAPEKGVPSSCPNAALDVDRIKIMQKMKYMTWTPTLMLLENMLGRKRRLLSGEKGMK